MVNLSAQEIKIKELQFSNRICINPMEGCDSLANGAPSDMTVQRYEKFAKSGAGLIWFEAVAVCFEGRASANQLYITDENVEAFAALVRRIKSLNSQVKVVCQITHSGRFSRPEGIPKPMLAFRDPYLDERYPIHKDFSEVTDTYLDTLPETYEKAVRLVKQAGFDGVDIKACHRYLLAELLSAHTRKGKYGGCFENRTRLMCEIFKRMQKHATDTFILCSRFNVYSAIEYPYGFGETETGNQPNFDEPIRLLHILQRYGLSLVNVTMGTPYYNPHINKPYNSGKEDPLHSVDRLLEGAGMVKKNCEGLAVVSTGYTYLKADAVERANKMLQDGKTDFVGFGRLAFAYKDFAKDMLTKCKLNSQKVCICCNKCSELLRAGYPAGCIVREGEQYMPYYKKLKKEGK